MIKEKARYIKMKVGLMLISLLGLIILAYVSHADENVMLASDHSGIACEIGLPLDSHLSIVEEEVRINLQTQVLSQMTYELKYSGDRQSERVYLPIILATPVQNDISSEMPQIYQDGQALDYELIDLEIEMDLSDHAQNREELEDIISDNQALLALEQENNDYTPVKLVCFEIDCVKSTPIHLDIHYPFKGRANPNEDEARFKTYNYYQITQTPDETVQSFQIKVIPDKRYSWSYRYIIDSNVNFEEVPEGYLYSGSHFPKPLISFSTYSKERADLVSDQALALKYDDDRANEDTFLKRTLILIGLMLMVIISRALIWIGQRHQNKNVIKESMKGEKSE